MNTIFLANDARGVKNAKNILYEGGFQSIKQTIGLVGGTYCEEG